MSKWTPNNGFRRASGSTPDDIDAAFEELDARYLAGEAAPYANTWTAVAGAYVAFNRHEIPAAPDWVNVDHRRGTTVGPGDMAANIQATWDVAPNIRRSIEAVHRLDNLGAVVTHTAHGTSREGFDAEWRLVALLTFEGDLISRAELFDEADLDAALARFDELHTQARRLANAATASIDPLSEKLAGSRLGRDGGDAGRRLSDRRSSSRGEPWASPMVETARSRNARARAEVGVEDITSTVIATRGERLDLSRTRYSGRDQRPRRFRRPLLVVGEINADERVAARIVLRPQQTSTPPSQSSMPATSPAKHATTREIWSADHAGVRRDQPTRTAADDAGLGQHRSPTGPGVRSR